MSPEGGAASSASAELLVVLGSANPPGRLRGALDGAICRARKRGLDTALLDLGERPVTDTAAEPTIAAIESARALLLAAPIHDGATPASLRSLFDLLPDSFPAGRPVAAVVLSDSGDGPTALGPIDVTVTLTAADFANGVAAPSARRSLDELLETLAHPPSRHAPHAHAARF